MNIKRKIKKAGVGLLASALFIGGAYAWLTNVDTATKQNSIKIGKIKIIFDNQTDMISLSGNDAIPMTHKYAKENLVSYKFDIVNSGDINLDYSIYPDNIYSSNIDGTKIDILLKDGAGEMTYVGNLKQLAKGNEEGRPLVSKKNMSPEERHSYELIAHLDSSLTLADYDGHITFNLIVEATQAQQNIIIDSEVLTENMYYLEGTGKDALESLLSEEQYNYMVESGNISIDSEYNLYEGVVYAYEALEGFDENKHSVTYYFINKDSYLDFELDGNPGPIIPSDQIEQGKRADEYKVGDTLWGQTITNISPLNFIGEVVGNYYQEFHTFYTNAGTKLFNEYEKEFMINSGDNPEWYHIYDGPIYRYEVSKEIMDSSPFSSSPVRYKIKGEAEDGSIAYMMSDNNSLNGRFYDDNGILYNSISSEEIYGIQVR